MRYRPLTDEDDLLPFLVHGVDWRDRGDWDADRVLAEPQLRHYIDGWPRAGDLGVGAEVGGALVAAAWLRVMPSDDPGYGFVAPDVPELSMAVQPAYRGAGVGSRLLSEVLAAAARVGIPRVSLSVEDGNTTARALYLRHGFVPVGRCGAADTMMVDLPPGSRTT